MSLNIVCVCLLVVIGFYYANNPLRHGRWFVSRRFLNWFPLGMTYAFLYMGRYNLTVAKNSLGTLMSNEDFGLIFAAGTVTYALSFLVNGPLVDKIGGKRGILIAAVGAAAANVALGIITWLVSPVGCRCVCSESSPSSTHSICISRATARFRSSR